MVARSNCSPACWADQRFRFNGKGTDLFGAFLFAIPATLFTLGLYWFWFMARRERYYWARTSFGTMQFRSDVTGGRLLLFTLGNVLLLLLTFGLGWPWYLVRRARFNCANIVMVGLPDIESIQQQAQAASAGGEGFSDLAGSGFLDLDLGF